MAEIKWSRELSVDVKEIDDQHKKLINIVNTLLQAILSGHDKEILNDIFTKLREYTVYHFGCEEELMEDILYPKRAEQVQEHSQLKKDVKAFQRQIYLHEDPTTDEVLAFMKGWMLDHILTHDRELARFIHHQKAQKDAEKVVTIEDNKD